MEPTETATTTATNIGTQAIGGITTTVIAAPSSQLANSLFSANWEQLITFSFHVQMGDIVGIVGLLLAIDAYRQRRKVR